MGTVTALVMARPGATDEEGGGSSAAPLPGPPATRLGVNLYGLQTFNRQQVFANLIAQSEWFSSQGKGWSAMPTDHLDALGWVTHLDEGQTAPRPLVLPPAPFGPVVVHCRFSGSGELSVGGAARLRASFPQAITLELDTTGSPDESAWIELVRTDPHDPVRDIDCRKAGTPGEARFDPEILKFLSDFRVIRFLDWQRTNDNAAIPWSRRTLPRSASQVGPGGASVEDMIALANSVSADPWFLMPYNADADYVAGFARLVHERLDPRRTVYVEFGNEVWNDMFGAAQQAEREGVALGLGHGDPMRARMERYSQRMASVMRIWTRIYADRPQSLVRVCASQNANPDLTEIVLQRPGSAALIDAVATAPYIWIDLDGYGVGDVDRVFAAMPAAIERTFAMARANRAIAAAHGKRFIAYEGGQHLVTRNLALAHAVQRDPRMEAVYGRYLDRWRGNIGDTLVLYASTTPIAEYGAWGLREYAGQPLSEAPKLRAVRRFVEGGS